MNWVWWVTLIVCNALLSVAAEVVNYFLIDMREIQLVRPTARMHACMRGASGTHADHAVRHACTRVDGWVDGPPTPAWHGMVLRPCCIVLWYAIMP